MKLDDAQKAIVAGWITDGLKLSEIQKRLHSELGLTVTYMDVRFLVDDLKLMPKDPPPKVDKVISPSQLATPAQNPVPGLPPLPGSGGAGLDDVQVTVDALARPGSMVSGNVTFTDGQSAAWQLDQMGRLGLVSGQPGYKPSARDLQLFQQSLERELSRMGF